nr:hypothetical protein [Tanacetum cinerariifolium]
MVMIVNNSFRLSMNRNQVTIRTMMVIIIHMSHQVFIVVITVEDFMKLFSVNPWIKISIFSGYDQIQNTQYPDDQENPLTNDKFEAYTIANDANMNDLQIKLDNFQKNQQDFQKKFEQKHDDFQNQMRNFMQNLYDGPPGEDKEHEATTDTELLSTEDIQPLPVQEPPQNSDIRQLIREECCIEVPTKQKQSMEDTMLELVKICQEKEFLCIHDNVDDLIESAFKFKLLLTNSNSQHLDKVVHKSSISLSTSQISSIHTIAPVLSTKEPEHLLSMGYEHLSITLEMESDEVTESNAENLLQIPSECKVTLEDKKECDVPIYKNSPVYDNHSDIFFDSKTDDDISVYDDDFEDVEYVEASLPDPEIVSVEEEVDFEDISQIQDIILREKLLSVTRLISNIESLNENPTPDRVLNSFASDNSLLDNFSPEFETFCDHSEETRSEEADLFLTTDNSIPSGIENVAYDPEGDICFLEELLIDDSILSHESSDSNFEDNPSIPRLPPESPDAETDTGEEIQVVMNDKDEDVDYSSFIFVIYPEMFSLLLSS